MIRNYLPNFIKARLWGDRERWGGLNIISADACWAEYQTKIVDLYESTQRRGVGEKINDAGYKVMSQVDLTGKKVLEIGAGDIRHIGYWRGKPSEYLIADVSSKMMSKAELRLKEENISYKTLLLKRSEKLPIKTDSFDVVVSFYSLEHLYPLQPYLTEMKRVLKSGGILIGVIPAEGGFAWGLGRYITSQRWFKKHTTINPDKIICWEHPNFADNIAHSLNSNFKRSMVKYWPFKAPVLDMNLIIQFIHKKDD